MIKAIAITAFVHGPLKLKRGDEAEFSPPTFTALEAQGLVRAKTEPAPEPTTPAASKPTRAARTPANKKAPDLQNQATATDPTAPPAADTPTDGTGQTHSTAHPVVSADSPPAPVADIATATASDTPADHADHP